MSELEKIFLTSGLTIFGGLSVYVVGQLLSRFIIDPVHELRKTIGEVRFNLAFHAATIHTPIGRSKETSDKAHEALMKSSCELIAKLQAIPCYGSLSSAFRQSLPPRKAIEDAAVQLRGLSTYVHEEGQEAYESIDVIRKRVEKIEKLLCLNPLV
jgi:hypothetical protein